MRGGRKLVNGRLVGDHYSETGKNGLRVVVPEIRGILLNAFIRLVLTITSPEVIHWKIMENPIWNPIGFKFVKWFSYLRNNYKV